MTSLQIMETVRKSYEQVLWREMVFPPSVLTGNPEDRGACGYGPRSIGHSLKQTNRFMLQ